VTRTFTPKAGQIQRDWIVIDATDVVLGRLASHAAAILRGKHKPTYAPHLDSGDHVIIINAAKVVLTSDKAGKKELFRHTGYPGGIKSETYSNLLARRPDEAVRNSIRGMLPHGPLGRQMITKLKVYAGAEHPHAAQSPVVLDLSAAKAR
jgi:large subunit ribosomal protein L13